MMNTGGIAPDASHREYLKDETRITIVSIHGAGS